MAPRRGAFRGFPSHLANGVEERKLLALFRACFTLIFLARGKRSIVSFLFHFPSSLVIRIDVFASRRFWSSSPHSTPWLLFTTSLPHSFPSCGIFSTVCSTGPRSLPSDFVLVSFPFFSCTIYLCISSLSNPDSFQLVTTRPALSSELCGDIFFDRSPSRRALASRLTTDLHRLCSAIFIANNCEFFLIIPHSVFPSSDPLSFQAPTRPLRPSSLDPYHHDALTISSPSSHWLLNY